MNLKEKEIKGKVVSYCEIPEELTEGHWISEYMSGCFVQCHIADDRDVELSPLDKWLIETYPELQDEEYFFIEIDY